MNKHGLYAFGEYVGVKVVPQVNRQTGEQYQEYYFGLKVPSNNGFEGQENFIEIKLSKKQIQDGTPHKFNEHVGKHIGLPIYNQVRTWSNKATGAAMFRETLWMSNDGEIIFVDDKDQTKSDTKPNLKAASGGN